MKKEKKKRKKKLNNYLMVYTAIPLSTEICI
jgi:hypothetical protein